MEATLCWLHKGWIRDFSTPKWLGDGLGFEEKEEVDFSPSSELADFCCLSAGESVWEAGQRHCMLLGGCFGERG